MLLAAVGLPPGADVDPATLGRLLDNWTISRYELEPGRIVFYLWSGAPEGQKFSFSFTPRFAVRAKAAPAKLFDSYNPDLSAVLARKSFRWLLQFRTDPSRRGRHTGRTLEPVRQEH